MASKAQGTVLTVSAFFTNFLLLAEEGAMSDLSRGERLQLMLSPEELQAIDDWRFNTRMPSRAAAIRELLKRGLQADGFALADQGSRSRDFGILDGE
jgi:hypothetical protein